LATVYFEYRRVGQSTWIETTHQEIISSQVVEANISSLLLGNNYEYRGVVIEDGNTVYGDVVEFMTLGEVCVYDGDTLRKLSLDEINNFDTLRQLILSEITNFDTLRKIAYGGYFNGKTYRSIIKYYEELFDTLRELVLDNTFLGHTLRELANKEIFDGDSLRQLIQDQIENFDTLRELVILDESSYDTLRKLIDSGGFSTGLLRVLRSATVEEEEGMENCYVFFKDAELAILGNSLDVSGFSDFNLELSSKFGSSFESIIEGKIDQNWYEIQSIKKDDLSLIGKPSIVGFYLIDLTGLKSIRCSLNTVLFDEITARGHLFKERDF